MFSQARAAGLDMDDLADRMRARKMTAMEEFQGGKSAQTRTMEGDDVQCALTDEPMDGQGVPLDR